MSEIQKHISEAKVPRHVAIIMDGNGRWAQKQGIKRIFGHHNAIESVRNATEGCAELGVEYLTLYAFSTENWDRPKAEVDALMTLLVETIKTELPTLIKNNIQLASIGDISLLPSSAQKGLKVAIEKTSNNSGMTLVLALNYSGRWDIVQAVNKILVSGVKEIDASGFQEHLATSGAIPDPDLMIRTSGELRISNFLLWQLAYSELYFTDVLWPDFRKKHLHEAIEHYQLRERRFGKTSDQINH